MRLPRTGRERVYSDFGRSHYRQRRGSSSQLLRGSAEKPRQTSRNPGAGLTQDLSLEELLIRRAKTIEFLSHLEIAIAELKKSGNKTRKKQKTIKIDLLECPWCQGLGCNKEHV